MIEVPKAYFKALKDKKENSMSFYQDVFQVSVKTSAIQIALDSETPEEISLIENLD